LFLGARSQRATRLFNNRWLQLSIGGAASVGLAYAAMRTIAWGDVADTFRSFPTGFVLLSLIPLAAAMMLRAARWHVLLRDEGIAFRLVFVTQNTGMGLNNVLPLRMMSEPVQLALVSRRYRVPFPTALASLVAGNVLDIFSTAILMALGVALVPGSRDGRLIPLFGALVMFVVSVLVFIAVAKGLDRIPIANRVDFFRRLTGAVDLLRGKPARVWASFFATFTHWLLLGVAGWVLATGLDIEIDPLTMTTILVAATFFTSATPSLPGGAGNYHFAIISMLTAMGIDAAAAFSFAIVMHLLVVVPPSAIALVMMSRVGADTLLRREEAEPPRVNTEPSLEQAAAPTDRPIPAGATPTSTPPPT
jgi:uncharacterized membrane protein YbhN (UPF0104 family)